MKSLTPLLALILAGCATPPSGCVRCSSMEDEMRCACAKADRLSRDLPDVEEKIVEIARDRRRLEEQIAGGGCPPP